MEGKAPAFKNSKAETNTRVKRSVSAILTYLDVFYRLLMCCSVYMFKELMVISTQGPRFLYLGKWERSGGRSGIQPIRKRNIKRGKKNKQFKHLLFLCVVVVAIWTVVYLYMLRVLAFNLHIIEGSFTFDEGYPGHHCHHTCRS